MSHQICNASEHKILISLTYFMIICEREVIATTYIIVIFMIISYRRVIATIYILIKPCILLYWFHSLTCLSRPSRERLRSPSLLLLSSSLQCLKHCFMKKFNSNMIILCYGLSDWSRQSHDRVNKLFCLKGIHIFIHLFRNLNFFISMVLHIKAKMSI